MVEHANDLSRNPNVCASCSSMADGMEDSLGSLRASSPPESAPAPAPTETSSVRPEVAVS